MSYRWENTTKTIVFRSVCAIQSISNTFWQLWFAISEWKRMSNLRFSKIYIHFWIEIMEWGPPFKRLYHLLFCSYFFRQKIWERLLISRLLRAGIVLKTSPIERYAFSGSKLYLKKIFNSKKKFFFEQNKISKNIFLKKMDQKIIIRFEIFFI